MSAKRKRGSVPVQEQSSLITVLESLRSDDPAVLQSGVSGLSRYFQIWRKDAAAHEARVLHSHLSSQSAFVELHAALELLSDASYLAHRSDLSTNLMPPNLLDRQPRLTICRLQLDFNPAQHPLPVFGECTDVARHFPARQATGSAQQGSRARSQRAHCR